MHKTGDIVQPCRHVLAGAALPHRHACIPTPQPPTSSSLLQRRQEEKRKEAEEVARLARIRQRIEQEEAQRGVEAGAAASGSDAEEEI